MRKIQDTSRRTGRITFYLRNIAVPLLTLAALGLTSCGSEGLAEGASRADSSSHEVGVEYGASKSEFIEAFDDVEPITLDFQVASASADSYSSQRDIQFAKEISEWSDGKIDVNIHYAGSIAGPTEVPDALMDGRLDIAQYFTMYEPQEMAGYVDLASSLSQVPSSPLVGEITSHAAVLEVAHQTPEIISEFTDRGMHVLYAANPNGNTALICTKEMQSENDWNGTTIRGSASAQETQIESLGGVLSSIEMAEGYEALERGLLDCSLQSPMTATANGWTNVAPHVYFPQQQSFAPGPGSVVAGSSWEELPLVARQLVFDKLEVYIRGEMYSAMASIGDLSREALDVGGTVQYLDTAIEDNLTEANRELIAEIETSTSLDGAALNEAVADSIEKWTEISEELGYSDLGGFDDFNSWYKGPESIDDLEYFEPLSTRMFEEIMLPHRPE